MIDFYDKLAPFYHLIYEDWNAAVEQQAEQLQKIIERHWPAAVRRVLDVSCGIGTQAVGLAKRNFEVTASDLSEPEIRRARHEAHSRQLDLRFSVCDMREAYACHGGGFDLVISCDNSVPHLLTDDDILAAFRQMYACLRPGGGCLITVRDYDKEERGSNLVKPYGVREQHGTKFLVFQVWNFDGDHYDLDMFFIEQNPGSAEAKTHVMRSRYYAISADQLVRLMQKSGFIDVQRLDGVFFQPVLVGTRPA